MSDTRQLSPQGYNIYDDPKNTNPFWGGEEPDDPTVYQRLTDLENAVDNIEDTMATESELDNYYNKDEIDARFNALPDIDIDDYSTTADVQLMIAQDHDDIIDIVDRNYYDKTNIDSKLAVKANITAFNNYYTKSEIDAMQADDDGRLDDLETTVGNHTTSIGNLTTAVGTAQNKADVALGAAGNAYDLAEAAKNIADGNADDIDDLELRVQSLESSMPDMSNYYTKSEVDGFIGTIDLDIDALQGSILRIDGTIGDINSVLEVVLNGNNI